MGTDADMVRIFIVSDKRIKKAFLFQGNWIKKDIVFLI